MIFKQGLKENFSQFALLVLINGLVGGMVGLERSILPQYADERFEIDSNTAILAFIVVFGISKALTNYLTGKFTNIFGRKNLLVTGWLIALPVPFLLIYAESWNWVIFANVLLGISQGLTWSSTVIMKIDLVGEKERGFAMGLNEFAGYLSVGLFAYLSAYIADLYGVNEYPFYLGILLSILGLILSLFLVRDTGVFVQQEITKTKSLKNNNVFLATTLTDKSLSSVTQAGIINNLNDGMMWGLFPVYLASLTFSIETIGILAGIYPVVWGVSQLFTGKLADLVSRKRILIYGMLIQGIAITFLPFTDNVMGLILLTVLLGLGTALVYPTFLAVIADASHPQQRAESLGVFRLWRDLGYAIGAIISGLTADFFGLKYAILMVGVLTILSGLVVKFRMPNKQGIV
jgi:MFS family permease